ncbi:MAG: SsrA-binding protein SmpB [Armatimonadetes bacterium]|nr:SsrA-binding protein SmpB [Armatimonadota bacterium]
MSGRKVIAVNRKARYNYEIEDTVDAGLVLTGTEIKSIRDGKVNLQDAYALIRDGEAWVMNMHIAPYEQGNRFNVDSRRTRKLLLHKGEIGRLYGKVQQRGLTLVPLSIYLQNGFAKLEIGVGRGKKLYDKRETIAERDRNREVQRALSGRD